MAAYEYSEWKEIIYSEIESNGGWETYAPSVVPDLLEKYADTLDDCKDDYVSLIVGLTIMKLQHYGIENYILERFQKLSGEGFDGYAYISNPQFQEDLKYISKLNVRDVADCTIQNTGKYSRKVDRLLSKYYSKKDRRESINRKDRLKIIRVTMLSVLGTLVFIGGFVWLCMVNAVVGGSLFALFCVLIFAIAMIRSNTANY